MPQHGDARLFSALPSSVGGEPLRLDRMLRDGDQALTAIVRVAATLVRGRAALVYALPGETRPGVIAHPESFGERWVRLSPQGCPMCLDSPCQNACRSSPGEVAADGHLAIPVRLRSALIATLCVSPEQGPAGHLPPEVVNSLRDLSWTLGSIIECRLQWLGDQAQQTRFADFARSSGDWLWETDEGLQLSWLSEGYEATTGLCRQQGLGQPLQGTAPRSASAEALRLAAESRRPFHRLVMEEHNARGVRHISYSGVPVFGPQGQFQGYRGTARDVTERVRAELAEQANRAKTAFMSRMSHELRTPLNGILGFSQIMEADARHPLPEAQRERLRMISQSGTRLLHLINDLLDLTRVELGGRQFDLRDIALDRAVHHGLQPLLALVQERGVRVEVAPDLAGLQLHADARAVDQILLNLLSNAIKYNRRGGVVSVSARPTADAVEVFVTDEGPGMTEQQQQHLFQPFNRLGAERSDTPGTGLGLVICRELANAMSGSLSLQSRSGQGTTVCLRLPGGPRARATDPDDALGDVLQERVVPSTQATARLGGFRA